MTKCKRHICVVAVVVVESGRLTAVCIHTDVKCCIEICTAHEYKRNGVVVSCGLSGNKRKQLRK